MLARAFHRCSCMHYQAGVWVSTNYTGANAFLLVTVSIPVVLSAWKEVHSV